MYSKESSAAKSPVLPVVEAPRVVESPPVAQANPAIEAPPAIEALQGHAMAFPKLADVTDSDEDAGEAPGDHAITALIKHLYKMLEAGPVPKLSADKKFLSLFIDAMKGMNQQINAEVEARQALEARVDAHEASRVEATAALEARLDVSEARLKATEARLKAMEAKKETKK